MCRHKVKRQVKDMQSCARLSVFFPHDSCIIGIVVGSVDRENKKKRENDTILLLVPIDGCDYVQQVLSTYRPTILSAQHAASLRTQHSQKSAVFILSPCENDQKRPNSKTQIIHKARIKSVRPSMAIKNHSKPIDLCFERLLFHTCTPSVDSLCGCRSLNQMCFADYIDRCKLSFLMIIVLIFF